VKDVSAIVVLSLFDAAVLAKKDRAANIRRSRGPQPVIHTKSDARGR